MEASIDQQRLHGVFGLVRTAGEKLGPAVGTRRHGRDGVWCDGGWCDGGWCDGVRHGGGLAAGGDPVGLELIGGGGGHGALQIEGEVAPWLLALETDEIFRSEVSASRPEVRAIGDA